VAPGPFPILLLWVFVAHKIPNPPKSPRPIVLDAHLDTPPDARLIHVYGNGSGPGNKPIILAIPPSSELSEKLKKAWKDRQDALEDAGATVLIVGNVGTRGIAIFSVLALKYL
jgi:riboflavin biosynthesis pyrimidine reductase